jgi:hypothetical protein
VLLGLFLAVKDRPLVPQDGPRKSRCTCWNGCSNCYPERRSFEYNFIHNPKHMGIWMEEKIMKTLSRDNLMQAGEARVISELCVRGIYSQQTTRNYKFADIFLHGTKGMGCVSVKSRQTSGDWMGNKGVMGSSDFLVLVDYAKKLTNPDFYILDHNDLKEVLEITIKRNAASGYKTLVKEDGTITTTKNGGKPFAGLNIRVKDVLQHKDRWDKITNALLN